MLCWSGFFSQWFKKNVFEFLHLGFFWTPPQQLSNLSSFWPLWEKNTYLALLKNKRLTEFPNLVIRGCIPFFSGLFAFCGLFFWTVYLFAGEKTRIPRNVQPHLRLASFFTAFTITILISKWIRLSQHSILFHFNWHFKEHAFPCADADHRCCIVMADTITALNMQWITSSGCVRIAVEWLSLSCGGRTAREAPCGPFGKPLSHWTNLRNFDIFEKLENDIFETRRKKIEYLTNVFWVFFVF